MDALVIIGSTIRNERKRQKLTLRDLAGLSYTSTGYLSEVERGHKEVSFSILESICDALVYPLPKLLQTVALILEEGNNEDRDTSSTKMLTLSGGH